MPNFIPNSTGQNIAMFWVYDQNFCSVLYIDSYFLSLIQKWVTHAHVFAGSQIRRSVSYLQITNIFLFKFTSLSRSFHSYRDEPIGRWGEKIVPQAKPPGTPASRTWLVLHVTSAGLEPTPATAVIRSRELPLQISQLAKHSVLRLLHACCRVLSKYIYVRSKDIFFECCHAKILMFRLFSHIIPPASGPRAILK